MSSFRNPVTEAGYSQPLSAIAAPRCTAVRPLSPSAQLRKGRLPARQLGAECWRKGLRKGRCFLVFTGVCGDDSVLWGYGRKPPLSHTLPRHHVTWRTPAAAPLAVPSILVPLMLESNDDSELAQLPDGSVNPLSPTDSGYKSLARSRIALDITDQSPDENSRLQYLPHMKSVAVVTHSEKVENQHVAAPLDIRYFCCAGHHHARAAAGWQTRSSGSAG